MKQKILVRVCRQQVTIAIAATVGLFLAVPAQAGSTISFGEDQSIGLGLEMRGSYTGFQNGAPLNTNHLNLDNISLKTTASLNKNIKAFVSTDRDAAENLKLKDVYARFDIAPEFNVMAGRMLPPSDRANLAGAYYALGWSFPRVVSKHPSVAFGRDDGVVVWGKLLDKKLVYSAGSFQGRNRSATASNQNGNLLFSGRLAVNFWDAEPAPQYFTGSTYFGSAEVFTVGLAALSQKDGVGNLATKDDYQAWNIDALIEKKLAGGFLTLDGAYYKYSFSPAAATADGRVTPGKALMLGSGFLFPEKLGWGKLQPYYRYQQFDADGTGVRTAQSDVGLNYVIDGSRAKVSGTYTRLKVAAAETISFVLGFQWQY
ncbi:MAG: porin [Gallionella sp.]|nr:porin [Gallionella sp.]